MCIERTGKWKKKENEKRKWMIIFHQLSIAHNRSFLIVLRKYKLNTSSTVWDTKTLRYKIHKKKIKLFLKKKSWNQKAFPDRNVCIFVKLDFFVNVKHQFFGKNRTILQKSKKKKKRKKSNKNFFWNNLEIKLHFYGIFFYNFSTVFRLICNHQFSAKTIYLSQNWKTPKIHFWKHTFHDFECSEKGGLESRKWIFSCSLDSLNIVRLVS